MKKLYILSLIILFTGCLKQKVEVVKKFVTIEHANKFNSEFSEEKNNVLLAVKKLDAKQIIELFGVDTIKCGFQPIQLTVRNFSSNNVYLNPTNIGLNMLSPKKIAKRCHWKTAEITTGAGLIATVFFWPALIPTAYYGYVMKNQNARISKKLLTDFVIQSWDNIKIIPLETVSKIVFVSTSETPNTFFIELFCKETKQELEFKVNLTQNK